VVESLLETPFSHHRIEDIAKAMLSSMKTRKPNPKVWQ
jgi:hypothetical protein